jgi:cell wall-associated NlpC family hydrolase
MAKLPRKLHKDSNGRDVRALQRALSQAGYRKTLTGKLELTNTFGRFLDKQLRAFQKDHKLPATGVLDQATFDMLWPYYDDRARAFVEAVRKARKAADEKAADNVQELSQRQQVVAASFVGYKNRYSIHYTQSALRWQGIDQKRRPPRFPNYADCSSYTTWCYWLYFGNGTDFINGQYWDAGYTGTQIAHGRFVSRAAAKPGDMVFYGDSFWNIHHVALYVGNGMVVSHGSEAGPLYLPIDYRSDRQQIRSYI